MIAGREVRLLLFYGPAIALPQTLHISGENVPAAHRKPLLSRCHLLKYYVKTAINYRVYTGVCPPLCAYFYGTIII